MSDSQLEKYSLLKASKGGSVVDYAKAVLQSTRASMPPIQYVPLNVPFGRRMETLSLLYYYTITIQSIVFSSLAIWLGYWPLLAAYFAFIAYDKGHENGGRPLEWVKRLPVWRGIAAYFPMKLVREKELDPSKQYLFGYHPHGVIANGAVIAFGTEALGFSKLFPGISVRPLTIKANFYVPFYREIVIGLGFCGPTKQCINNLYKQGNSCLIVVGGAEESLISAPNTADLVLKNRMGFVAMAIKNGASLVPVYCFGENECFNILIPEENSPVQRLQQWMKRVLGFTIPLYYGRSIFTYNYGFLPKRYPTTVVVGSPIPTIKEPSPSPELVAKVHHEYMEALQDLYDRNKAKYTHGDVIPNLNFL